MIIFFLVLEGMLSWALCLKQFPVQLVLYLCLCLYLRFIAKNQYSTDDNLDLIKGILPFIIFTLYHYCVIEYTDCDL